MKAIIAILLAAMSAPALACYSNRGFENVMEQAMWTVDTGANHTSAGTSADGDTRGLSFHRETAEGQRTAHVRIALPPHFAGDFCRGATWDVELSLPEGVSMAEGDDGNAKPSSYEGLALHATAVFEIVVPSPAHSAEVRRERTWLRVRVHDGSRYLRWEGGDRTWFPYPVTVNVGA